MPDPDKRGGVPCLARFFFILGSYLNGRQSGLRSSYYRDSREPRHTRARRKERNSETYVPISVFVRQSPERTRTRRSNIVEEDCPTYWRGNSRFLAELAASLRRACPKVESSMKEGICGINRFSTQLWNQMWIQKAKSIPPSLRIPHDGSLSN